MPNSISQGDNSIAVLDASKTKNVGTVNVEKTVNVDKTVAINTESIEAGQKAILEAITEIRDILREATKRGPA